MAESTSSSSNGSIDYRRCMQKGLIGGIGAIPGTFGSHPFDVIKIRMQTRGDALSHAIRTVKQNGTGMSGFYRGFVPAIEQRLVTRAPMFLVSELYTQIVRQNTDFGKTASTYIGSCGSGFTTGFLAGVAEYRKKLLSQSVISSKEARIHNLIRTATKSGQGYALFRRLVAAGTCSATYDSFFFGTECLLSQQYNISPALSYGCGAVVAVVAAFAFDTVVARMMIVAPDKECPTFTQTLKEVFKHDPADGRVGIKRITRGYRGLSARAVEFFVNYSITGMCSVYIKQWFPA